MMKKNIIIIDLDGTLILNDLLVKIIINLIKCLKFNLKLFALYFVNKNKFKTKIFNEHKIKNSEIRPNLPLISWLNKLSKEKNSIILATGSPYIYAKYVKNKYEFIDHILTSDNKVTLTGKHKAHLLVKKFGIKKFTYVGNSLKDFYIWRYAKCKILTNNKFLKILFRKYFDEII